MAIQNETNLVQTLKNAINNNQNLIKIPDSEKLNELTEQDDLEKKFGRFNN